MALLADVIAPGDPFASAGPALRPPSTEHLMGTDNLGRDVFRAVVHGARTSMTVVVGVLLISSAIGIVVGAVAGYRGGLVDDVLMRITEVFQSLPHFFLALLVVALFGSSLRNLVVFLGLTSWELLARVVRAETLSIRQQAFVEAAQAAGATDRRILFRHVVPNSLPSATVVMALVGSTVILIEAGLSFIGLGDQTQMSWGFLINNAETFLQVAWWMSVFPGLAIVIAVLGLNLLSDGLNDALNPSPDSSRRLRPRGKLRARLAARRDPPATRAGRRRRVPA
ncbi:MAG: ABC transporter permease [Actinomycetota bacterium]|nr:ABC transporter permease [Actinomycetota bacterium]